MATLENYRRLVRACEPFKPVSKLTHRLIPSAVGIAHSCPLRETESQTERRKDQNWDMHRSRELLSGLVKPLFELAYQHDAGFPRRPSGPMATKSHVSRQRTELLFELLGFQVTLNMRDSNPNTGCISWSPPRPVPDYATCFRDRRQCLKGNAEKAWFDEVIRHLDRPGGNGLPLARYFSDSTPQAAAVQAPQANLNDGFDFSGEGANPWPLGQVPTPPLTPVRASRRASRRPLRPAPQHQAPQVNSVGNAVVVDLTGAEEDLTSAHGQALTRLAAEFVAREQQFGLSQDFMGVGVGQAGQPGMVNAVNFTQHQTHVPLQPTQPYRAPPQDFGAIQGYVAGGSNQAGQQRWTGAPVQRAYLPAPSHQMATQQAWRPDTGVVQAPMGYGGNQFGQPAGLAAPFAQQAHLELQPQPMQPQQNGGMAYWDDEDLTDFGEGLNFFE